MTKYFILLIVLLVFSGCVQNKPEYSTTPNNTRLPDVSEAVKSPELYSNATVPNVTSQNNTDKLSKCTDEEASGTEEEIDEYLKQGQCAECTKREGMYPFPLESIGSREDIYTKGFCCKVAALPGRDF